MGKELPVRKIIRLKDYDYSQAGVYFVTVCVQDGHEMLCRIVGSGFHARPQVKLNETQVKLNETQVKLNETQVKLNETQVKLTEIGIEIQKSIEYVKNNNENIDIPKYVIMPNHIHLIVVLKAVGHGRDKSIECGEDTAVGHGNPTLQSVVGRIKSYTAKRWSEMCGEKYQTFWQSRFYDEIIRNEETYQNIWHYIDENPQKWAEDDYFIKN